MTQAHESRPEKATPEAAKSFGGDYDQYSDTTDITTLGRAEWALAMEFYQSGYAAGVAAGRRYESEELAAIQREAVRIVHAMANISPRDRDADRARRQRIDARFGGGHRG